MMNSYKMKFGMNRVGGGGSLRSLEQERGQAGKVRAQTMTNLGKVVHTPLVNKTVTTAPQSKGLLVPNVALS
jgi:hypothetical protein